MSENDRAPLDIHLKAWRPRNAGCSRNALDNSAGRRPVAATSRPGLSIVTCSGSGP
jgi:hypothetical protein